MPTSVVPLAEVGTPSWSQGEEKWKDFPSDAFPAACIKVLDTTFESPIKIVDSDPKSWMKQYARLSVLRAAYYSIMIRATTPIGPGLTEDSRIDAAPAYIA